MATTHIQARADELRASGLTEVRTFRRLRSEFPGTERDTLVDAARISGHRKHIHPSWTQNGGFLLNPVKTKYKTKPINEAPPKKRDLRRTSLTATTFQVPADELRPGDYIEDEGLVGHVGVHHKQKKLLMLIVAGIPRIINRDQIMSIHLEDRGGR